MNPVKVDALNPGLCGDDDLIKRSLEKVHQDGLNIAAPVKSVVAMTKPKENTNENTLCDTRIYPNELLRLADPCRVGACPLLDMGCWLFTGLGLAGLSLAKDGRPQWRSAV